jgi:hypothetical protein
MSEGAGDLSGGDFYLFAGLRVPTLPGGSLGHAEGAKINQGYFVTFLKRLCYSFQDGIYRRLSFLLRARYIGLSRNQITFIHKLPSIIVYSGPK